MTTRAPRRRVPRRIVDSQTAKGTTLLHKWQSAILAIGAAMLLLAWKYDPPLRSNLTGGAVISWMRSGLPQDPRQWTQLFVKIDDGRTVRVTSERTAQPTVGERVLVQERIGLLGTRTFYEMPN